MNRVTVCLAVYNGQETLSLALDSVFAQTYRDFDVLVVDDGSDDDSAEIARKAGCRVIQVPNAGLGAGRKLLVEEADGELIAFIDHDDEWLPEKLDKQIAFMDAKGADLVHSDGWYIYEDARVVPRDLAFKPGSCSFEHILPGNRIIASTAVFKREAMLAAGNFVAETVRCSDWFGWLILAPTASFEHLPEKLVRYQVREASLANAGFRFHEAQHFLLTQMILPRREQLFANLTVPERSRYTQMLVRDVGIALSGMAKYRHLQGNRKVARELHLQALKTAPDVMRVWTRAVKAFLT